MKYLLIFILVSCSSQKSSKETNEIDSKEEIKDLPIQNSDFKVKKPRTFVKSQDYYDKRPGLLESETQFRLVEDNKNKDVIIEMIKSCYQGQFEQAFDLQRNHYQEYLENPSFWNQVGTCHLLQKNYRKALLYYNRSREIDKNYTPSLNNMGVLFQSQGQDSKAIEMFKSAIQSAPLAKTPKVNLSSLYLKYGLVNKAEMIISALYKQAPNDQDTQNLYAHLLGFNGQWKEANLVFQKLLKGKNVSTHTKISASLALIKIGQTKAAGEIMDSVDQESLEDKADYYEKVAALLGEMK